MEGIFTAEIVQCDPKVDGFGEYYNVTLEIDIGPFKKGESDLRVYYDPDTNEIEFAYVCDDDEECNRYAVCHTCKLAELRG
jgi:hypothetical protein